MSNVVAIPSQAQEAPPATCPGCGAPLVADQRYCLSCGQPCSPVRLPFLDVLQAQADAQAHTTVLPAPAGYLPAAPPDGAIGWLRRYSGLLALVGVLLLTATIGLLIGHWTKGTASSGPQVVKIEGLPSAALATPAAAASTQAATTTPQPAASAKQAPLSEPQEKKEVKEAEATTVKSPPPAKVNSTSLKKLSQSTGKAHQKEIESLTAGGKPIETGG